MRDSFPLLNARRLSRPSGKSLFEMQAELEYLNKPVKSRYDHTIKKIQDNIQIFNSPTRLDTYDDLVISATKSNKLP